MSTFFALHKLFDVCSPAFIDQGYSWHLRPWHGEWNRADRHCRIREFFQLGHRAMKCVPIVVTPFLYQMHSKCMGATVCQIIQFAPSEWWSGLSWFSIFPNFKFTFFSQISFCFIYGLWIIVGSDVVNSSRETCLSNGVASCNLMNVHSSMLAAKLGGSLCGRLWLHPAFRLVRVFRDINIVWFVVLLHFHVCWQVVHMLLFGRGTYCDRLSIPFWNRVVFLRGRNNNSNKKTFLVRICGVPTVTTFLDRTRIWSGCQQSVDRCFRILLGFQDPGWFGQK